MNLLPNPNGVKIYNVTAGKTLPEWLKEKKKKSLRYDKDFRQRIELIQDFEYPTACTCFRLSPNGEFLVTGGVYKPRIRVYELAQLGLKFERHLDCEIVSLEVLSEDYSKLAMLRTDRTIEFHSSTGKYYQLRIPRAGRTTLYDRERCELWTGGASNELWRLNLELGQFLPPIATSLTGVTCLAQNDMHRLVAAGGSCSTIECIDPRTRKPVGNRNIEEALTGQLWDSDGPLEISSVAFASDGLTLGIGTSSGHSLLYDLRSPNPIHIQDNHYGSPIKSLEFLPEKRVMSADSKIIKVWEREGSGEGGQVYCSMEPPNAINQATVVPNSGLFLVAPDHPKLMAYFVPSLGPAPSWCSFLDNLTEELEEDQQTLYDDFKFVTREDLEKLALTKLLGTEYLRPYMHGYFIDIKMYNKLRAIARPFEWEEYKQARIQAKIREEEESRISAKRKLPKVNAKAAARLLAEEGKKNASSLLDDERFKDLWEKEEFAIDEEDEKFKLYHPRKLATPAIEEHFEPVEEEEEKEESEDNDSSEEEKPKKTSKGKVGFYELKTGHSLKMPTVSSREKKMSFSERVAQGLHTQQKPLRRKNVTGNMEVEFTPSLTTAELKGKEKEAQRKAQYLEKLKTKRGVGALGLKRIDIDKKMSRKRRR